MCYLSLCLCPANLCACLIICLHVSSYLHFLFVCLSACACVSIPSCLSAFILTNLPFCYILCMYMYVYLQRIWHLGYASPENWKKRERRVDANLLLHRCPLFRSLNILETEDIQLAESHFEQVRSTEFSSVLSLLWAEDAEQLRLLQVPDHGRPEGEDGGHFPLDLGIFY